MNGQRKDFARLGADYTNVKDVYDVQPITFDCNCSKKNTYAYVYPSQPYKIYLCGAF